MKGKVVSLLLFLLIAVLAIGNLVNKTVVAQSSDWQAKVDGWVLETAVSQSTTEFLVYLHDQADLSGADALKTKEEKGTYVFEQLTAVAEQTQPAVMAQLDALGVTYKPFWVANMIWVRGDISVVQAMAQREDIAHIYANPSVPLDLVPPDQQPTEQELVEAAMTVEWNIALVQAPQVWAAGFTGQGAVIGGQDTGYDWDHAGLINQYRGWNGSTADHNYNWHDSITSGNGGVCGLNSPFPCDDNGHGTHTMGTMVGDDGGTNQVGMAPGARWIGCRNMDQGNGTPATYSECYQWFIAPTDLNDQNPDPNMAPHVINNSWSCPPSEGCTDPNVMLAVVQAVRAAGIVTVHAASNAGPNCSTVRDPATIYAESFSVGSTTSGDVISSFSSRGPVTIDGSNRRKPDISAPGSGVRSTTPNGGYGTSSGTSMASPHVAGLVGLIVSAAPSMAGNVDAIEDLIEQTAVPKTTTQGCGGDGPTDVPNNVYGWGRIDAWAAYQGLALTLGKTGTAMAAPGQPITYTISVNNTSSVSTTNNLVLTDTIPAGTTFITASVPFTFDGTTITWTLSSLAPSSIWQTDLMVQTALDATQDVINADYGVRSDESNGTIIGNPVTTVIVPYDLQVSKTAPAAVSPGSMITYTLLVNNNHPFADHNGVWLSDTIPVDTTFVTATLPHTFDGTAVWWNIGTLTAGNSWQADLVTQTALTGTGSIANDTYSATAEELLTPVAGDPVMTDLVGYDLQVSKSAPGAVLAESLITYTLTVLNNHPFAANHNVWLSDTIPADTTFVTATLPHTFDGTAVWWNVGTLGAGNSWQAELIVQVNLTDTGVITNSTYSATADELLAPVVGDPVTTDVTAYALAVSKAANVTTTVPGGIISYTLTVYNPHVASTVTSLVLSDTLPLNTTFLTATTPYTMTGQTVQWEAQSLAPGASWDVTMVVQVNETMGAGTIVNSDYGVLSAEIVGESGEAVETAVTIPSTGDTNIYLPFINRADDTPPPPPDFATQVVNLVNEERDTAGCNSLTIQAQLVTAALGHSTDMALNDFFDHTGSNGSSPWERMNDAGYTFSAAAENIAAGYNTPETAVAAWMDSPGHRANILNCSLQETGVGYYYLDNDTGSVNYNHYWTQVFGTP